MALLLPSSLALISSSSHSLVSPTHRCFHIASPNIAIRLPWKSLSNSVLPFQKKIQILTRASSEASGEESTLPLPENIEESVSVENLPLQSKQQQKYELGKKLKANRILRRRTARLWRKRLMRKRGKWTIAKMKKWGKKKAKKGKAKKKKKSKKRKY